MDCFNYLGLKTELLEWLEPSTYERFVTEIAPRVKVSFSFSEPIYISFIINSHL